jgi:hypothetical protein
MLDKIDSGSKLQTQLPVFISWRSSGREAGEKQPLEALFYYPCRRVREGPSAGFDTIRKAVRVG